MRGPTRAPVSLRYALVALLVGFGAVLASEPVQAQQNCTCEGAVGPQIQPFMMVKGNAVTIDLCYTNTAKVSGGIVNNVEVDLTGNVYTRLACSGTGCLTEGDGGNSLLELPGTLTFDSCVASPLSPGAFADVASCALDASHVNGNTVLIQLDADGLHFTDNQVLCIARIQATAAEPVPSLTGTFLTRVATDPDGIVVAEPAGGADGVTCANNGDDCGTNGTNSANFAPVCEVEVDKQISCDGGVNFVDVGFGDNIAESCDGWNAFDGMAAEQIIVKYVTRNSPDSDLALSNCVLGESNGGIGDPADPGTIALDDSITVTDDDQTCSDELAANEPNTATVTCECLVEGGSIPAMDSDTADFACLEPRLQVEKQCVDTDDNEADDSVTIDVMNLAGDNTADLVNCVLTDTLDTNEPSANCPGDGVGLEDVPVSPSMFDLAAGGLQSASGTIDDRLTASCNTASVTCDIVGAGGKTVTATDDFPCRPLSCDVRLDKVLIVDGVRIDEGDLDVRVTGQGISWAGFDGMPPDDVDFEFIVDNQGTANAECTLVDVVEGGSERVNQPVLVAAGEQMTVTVQSACTAEIAGIDTATLSCTCIDEVQGEVMDSDTDSAELLCLVPGLAVVKECVDTNSNEAADKVNITVMNTGTADLTNCQVTDFLDTNQAQCPGTQMDQSVTVAPQGFALAAGTPGDPTEQLVTGTFADLTADACNNVSVTCTIDTTAKTITATNDTECQGVICEASFDKQVSCDGVTFVDVEANDDPDNGVIRGCTGWNAFDSDGNGSLDMPAEPAIKRFVVDNSTSNVAIECSITDVNAGTQMLGPFTVPAGQLEDDLLIEDTCSPDLSGIDTATLSCSCVGAPNLEITELTPFVDEARIDCKSPDLEVTKLCRDQVNGRNEISIGISNPTAPDGASLENCTVSDPLAPECDGAPVTSPLAPGASDTVLCGIDGLSGTITNEVTVTCDIQDTSKQISDTAEALCDVPEDECITRTPGFWCTHPSVTNLFLDVTSCGLTLNNVQVGTPGSAIEDLAKGGEHKAADTSPQQLQLIRQCTAAALNQAASLQNDGDCGGTALDASTFGNVFQQCCTQLCPGATAAEIDGSGCIGLLDQFNNSEDTFATLPPPFDSLGSSFSCEPDAFSPTITSRCNAQSDRCDIANGNGFVNPRMLGPGSGGGKKK